MAVRLERLATGQPIVAQDRSASLAFAVTWQRLVEQLEAQEAVQDLLLSDLADLLADLTAAVASIAAAQAAADAANAAAAAANTAATNAQTTADNITAASELSSSYVSGATITATDAGADATITISAHSRHYPQPDGSVVTVAVNGGSLTGLAYSTRYFIYYDQASRAGGAVTYASTTSDSTAAQIGDRHLVGEVTTPAALAANTDGDYTLGPGVWSF